jgi:hypothetical protein
MNSGYLAAARVAEDTFRSLQQEIKKQVGSPTYDGRTVSGLMSRMNTQRELALMYSTLACAEFLEELIKMRGTNEQG